MPSILHDHEDNSHSSAPEDSESEVRSRTQHIHQTNGPEAEILTSYSQRRRRKSRRRTMGMERPEYIVKGNDPFDYEQKFPEDKRHEEMGPTARVWRTYLEECEPYDIEMVEGWRDGLDVLLVFAGLFSAVVTTFVAQTSQSLQVDYGEVTTLLLIELINVQRSASNGSLVNDVPRSNLGFRPSMSDSWVNGLWFTSLSLSLTTALFAVLTKQWIHQYMAVPSGTPQDRCRVRQFRYMGLQQWRVAFIIGLLPVLMSASLAVFLVGLVLFIVPLRVPIAGIVGAITFISFSSYIVTNFLPILYPSCPYKTPLSQYIFPLYTYTMHNGLFNWLISPISKLWTRPSFISTSKASTIRTLRDAERVAVEDSADAIDVQALAWLIHMSSNPSVRTIVIESMSALPLKSAESLKRHTPRISVECFTAFENLGSTQSVSVLENKVDRLLRAYLRFADSFYIGRMQRPVKGCFSPGIYADLLSVQTDRRKEIRELVISNLRAVPDDPTVLRLQPIVWAYLLQKLLPYDHDDLEVMQLLFVTIPPFYWRAGFISPIHFMEREGMKILYKGGPATTLQMAIQEVLYLYVAEVILQDHVGDETTIFRQDYDLSPPQDSRLYLLLNMAGSPSIRSMAIPPYSSFHSLFGTILRCIGDFLDVSASDNNLLPTVALDTNRHAVLKLLYDLILSAEFEDSVTHRDQISVLMTFFRVLSSTFPLPLFLARDWCTPQLATKMFQIAFEDTSRTWFYHEDYCHTAYELGTYFFRHTSFTNEAFAQLVSTLFEQLHKQDGRALSVFLDLIITGLASEQLDVQVRQQSLDYLYEPKILFASCTTLITWGDASTLRRLALLRPEDPVWSDCLRQLELFDFPEPASRMHDIPYTISGFKSFVEAGCVGAFGKAEPASSNFMRLDLEDMGSRRQPWWTRWHKIRRLIPGKPSREETRLSSDDNGV